MNSFLFLYRFSASQKSLDNYFFRKFTDKSLLNRFSLLINYIMWSYQFSTSSCFPRFSRCRFFWVQVFQGSGFSGSRARVQVLEVAQQLIWFSYKRADSQITSDYEWLQPQLAIALGINTSIVSYDYIDSLFYTYGIVLAM